MLFQKKLLYGKISKDRPPEKQRACLIKQALKKLVSTWAPVRLQVESKMEHRCHKLVLLLAVASLPAGYTDRLTRFIRTIM